MKGERNMTSLDFCKWVNKTLLPNSTLEPGYLRMVSAQTACRWLHHLGFEVITTKKGIFIDGHERDDVVEQRSFFLRRMAKIGFLHPSNAPTECSLSTYPDVDVPTIDTGRKLILFQYERIFSANVDQNIMWGTKGQTMINQNAKELEYWFLTLSMNIMDFLL